MARFAGPLLPAAFALLLLGACPEEPQDYVPEQSVAAATCTEPAQGAAWRAKVLSLINQERANHDLASLAHNQVLEDQANQYACEMIEGGFVGHVNPRTGSALRDRSIEFGYDGVYIGENLYEGEQSPAEVVSGWMASTRGHREAILDERFTEVGIGIRVGGEHGLYWVLEFGRPQLKVEMCTEPPPATAWCAEVVRLINAERAAEGLAVLEVHPALAQAAEEFACEMIDYCFFDHVNPHTGVMLRGRLEASGYDGLAVGESLARGPASPAEAVAEWLADDTNWENLIDPRFNDVGVAVRAGGGRGYYWVVEFGQAR